MPEGIGRLTSLRKLVYNQNAMVELPESLASLTQLTTLDVRNQRWKSPNDKVCESALAVRFPGVCCVLLHPPAFNSRARGPFRGGADDERYGFCISQAAPSRLSMSSRVLSAHPPKNEMLAYARRYPGPCTNSGARAWW